MAGLNKETNFKNTEAYTEWFNNIVNFTTTFNFN